MALRPSYTRESRSQYARSSSFDDNRSSLQRSSSSSVIEREVSYPPVVWNYFDDPFFFPRRARLLHDDCSCRLRWRCYDDVVAPPIDFERNVAISCRDYNDTVSVSTTRTVPIQCTPAPSTVTIYREKIDKNDWTTNSSSIQRQEETYKSMKNLFNQ